MAEKLKGTCKHGEFYLEEGCPQCIDERQLKEQINAVVEARAKVKETTECRTSAYQKWIDENQPLLDNESNAKTGCQEAETKLRDLALQSYAKTKEKTVAPGIGIRVMTRLNYESQKAMEWAMEHKLALKLDSSAFEKIAKTSNLPFVTITEEPVATIATELAKVE